MDAPVPKLLRACDVAEILGIGENAAYELMNTLRHVRIGRRIRVHPEVLAKWIKSGGDATASSLTRNMAVMREAAEPPRRRVPSARPSAAECRRVLLPILPPAKRK